MYFSSMRPENNPSVQRNFIIPSDSILHMAFSGNIGVSRKDVLSPPN